MVTKKDFQVAADILKRDLPNDAVLTAEEVRNLFCKVFAEFNPRFNRDRFLAAANPSDNG